MTLKGKHPSAEDSLEDIPNACLDCHDAGSKKAPPFGQLLHLVHLTGANNEFVTTFKGDCTHCHKLDAKTGALLKTLSTTAGSASLTVSSPPSTSRFTTT